MKKILIVSIALLAFVFCAPPATVDLAVTVVGNVFTLELQDANAFPLAGELELGRLEPGQGDFPVNGVVVAGCKSNLGNQWSLQAELQSPLTDRVTGRELPGTALKVRGLSPVKSPGGVALPGNLITVEQGLGDKPCLVYTSDNTGDTGFNNYEGSYVPLGFGVKIPGAQPKGTYTGRVLLTLTE
jgi:hypothetical protein